MSAERVASRARLTGRAKTGDDLTPSELRVLTLIADGKTTNEIGEELFNSPETIRRHVRGIFDKLETRTRAHAIAIGFRRGLLS